MNLGPIFHDYHCFDCLRFINAAVEHSKNNIFFASVGGIPFEFRRELWGQKTRVTVLSCGVICVILRLTVLIQYRSVTDTQTDRQTDGQTHDDGIYRA